MGPLIHITLVLCTVLGHVQKWSVDLCPESGACLALGGVGFWSETKYNMSSLSVSSAPCLHATSPSLFIALN